MGYLKYSYFHLSSSLPTSSYLKSVSVSGSQHLVAVGIRPTKMNYFNISKLFAIASTKVISLSIPGNSLFSVSGMERKICLLFTLATIKLISIQH